MSFEFYKIIHIAGVLMLFSGLVGLVAVRMVSVTIPDRPRKLFFLWHGIGLLLALVAGFGMMARLQLFGNLPGWIYAKLAIWLILGGSVALAKRKGELGGVLLLIFLLLA